MPGVPNVAAWSVADVEAMLWSLELGHLAATFRTNGINGKALMSLSSADYVQHLGLTELQARNIVSHLRSLGVESPGVSYGGGRGGGYEQSEKQWQPQQERRAPAQPSASPAAERAKQAGNLLRDSLIDLQHAEQILVADKRLATNVLGLDVLGIGLGGGFGGFGGAFDGNLIGDAVTLFADLKEQQMAQQADAAVQQAANRIMQAKQLAPDIPQIDLAVVRSLRNGIYLDVLSGALSEYVIRKQLKKSLDSVRVMLAQVYAAMDWLSRTHGVPQAAPPGAFSPQYQQAGPYGPQQQYGSGGAYSQQNGGAIGGYPQYGSRPQNSGAGYGQQPGVAAGVPVYGPGGYVLPGSGYDVPQPNRISQSDGCSIM